MVIENEVVASSVSSWAIYSAVLIKTRLLVFCCRYSAEMLSSALADILAGLTMTMATLPWNSNCLAAKERPCPDV